MFRKGYVRKEDFGRGGVTKTLVKGGRKQRTRGAWVTHARGNEAMTGTSLLICQRSEKMQYVESEKKWCNCIKAKHRTGR